MSRLPHPPDSTRFFARVHSAILECPRCGLVMAFGQSWTGRHGLWNKRTGTLRCPDCGLMVVVGLLAWPLRQGSHDRTLPRDQVPNERQLAQLRARGHGWWMPDDTAKQSNRPDDTNITASCSCKPGTANTDAQDHNCPIHGDQVPPPVPPPFVDDDGNPL